MLINERDSTALRRLVYFISHGSNTKIGDWIGERAQTDDVVAMDLSASNGPKH